MNIQEQMIKVNEAVHNHKLATVILIKECQELLRLVDTAEQSGINTKQLQGIKTKTKSILAKFERE